MFFKVFSSAVLGIDGQLISVEADVSEGLPTFVLVGYLSSSVRESGERVRTALKNSNFHLPPKRITINLSPANLHKEGSGFDLPIALALLVCIGIEPVMSLDKTIIIGELGLNGQVNPIPGVLPMLCHCKKLGFTRCIVPYDNVNEALLVDGIQVIGVKSLNSLVDYLLGCEADFAGVGGETMINSGICDDSLPDFSEIKGQETLKRGMEIAVSGFHNVLMSGAAGSGKSMLAKRLPSIMPKMSFSEALEVTKIYSVNGSLLDNTSIISRRPFRSPHHTISSKALVGGGVKPVPGEVSLAHNGVLFLDEFPEFNKNVLEVLRQPIEDREVTISRVNAIYRFPSDFMLVAAMNPCPCGNYPDMQKCTCSPLEIKRYQSKISGPLLDRIDINMEVKALSYDDIFARDSGESSDAIRCRVEEAREIQKKRYSSENINFNSQLEGKMLRKYIRLNERCEQLLKDTFRSSSLSARAVDRICKLARTIADVEHSDEISVSNVEEAIFFRNCASNRGGNLW